MQLRQTEAIRPVDDNCVCGGYVDTAFDDCAANENVEPLVIEITHDGLELAPIHLPMGYTDYCVGNNFTKAFGHSFDRTNVIVQKVDLPTAMKLSSACLFNEGL